MSNKANDLREPHSYPNPAKKDLQDGSTDQPEKSRNITEETSLAEVGPSAATGSTPDKDKGTGFSEAERNQVQETGIGRTTNSSLSGEVQDRADESKETNGNLSVSSESKQTSDSMPSRRDPGELHYLRDEVSKLRQHGATLEDRLKEEKRRREWADHVLGERQEELSAQESALQAKETELARLKQDLARARDHIFELQPRRTEITEMEAAAAFNDLYLGVKRWVQNRLDPILADLDEGRLNDRGSVPYRGKLLSLVRDDARGCFKIDQSDEYHIIACVWQFLAYHLLEKAFYCPLDSSTAGNETIKFLNTTCDAMTKLPRDYVQVRNWRSEALTAITSQSEFKARELQHIDTLSHELAVALSVVMPDPAAGANWRAFEDSVRSSIMEPAVNLVHQLQLATRVYSIVWWVARKPGKQVNLPVDLPGCELLNIMNGGQPLEIRKGASKHARPLFSVAPGLLVQDANSPVGPARALRKPVVLVHDGHGDVMVRETIMSWVESGESQQQQQQQHSQQSQGPSGTTGKRSQTGPALQGVRRSSSQSEAKPPSNRRTDKGVFGRILGR